MGSLTEMVIILMKHLKWQGAKYKTAMSDFALIKELVKDITATSKRICK